MQKHSIVTIWLFAMIVFTAACSGNKNHQSKNQQTNQAAIQKGALGNRHQQNKNGGGEFSFTINGKKYTATSNHSMYVGYSNYNALTLTGDSKAPGQSLTLKIEIFTKKEGFKSGKYKLKQPTYRGNGAKYYKNQGEDGPHYYGDSQKGFCVITDFHKTSSDKGIISGHFQF